MQSLVVFDADNTLWDTNLVFRNAQLALLDSLARDGIALHPLRHLDDLRSVDALLGIELGRAEYDFRLLVTALVIMATRDLTPEQAARQTLSTVLEDAGLPFPIIKRAYSRYSKALLQIPPLYPGTKEVLACVRASHSKQDPLVMALLSEGNKERLGMILDAYKIRDEEYFDEILIAPKSKQVFEEVKKTGFGRLPEPPDRIMTLAVMVGDSLQRDIKLANQAGFTTIYKPSAFKGRERPEEADEIPDYIISALTELPRVLSELGIPIRQTREASVTDEA